MKKAVRLLAMVALTAGFAAAQSSGNFSAAYFPTACAINSSTGGFGSGGACNTSGNSTDCKLLDTTIKTSSGNGITLAISPSAVTGLYTDTKISNLNTSATAQIGIQVCVKVDGSGASVVGGDDQGCVMMDERFQQLSSNLFSQITSCATATTDLCDIDLILSTLSAHSYNFVAQVPNGSHHVTASWSVVNANTTQGGTVGACVGPGNVTVTQTKLFNDSGAILQY